MSQINTNSIYDASGGSNAVLYGVAAPANSMGFRNRIINGGMVIDQRNAGASVSVSSNYTGIFGVDRFAAVKNGAGVFTLQQSTVAPTGFTNSLLATVTTADASIATDDFAFINQLVEGFNVADLGFGAAGASAITVSFWVRSNLTGTYAAVIANGDGTRSYVTNYTVNVANTWEQKTVTVTGDTTGTWLKTNGAGMLVRFGLTAGSTFQQAAGSWGTVNAMASSSNVNWLGTVGNNFYITGVQLEAGSVASPFERRDYGRELMMAQRYFVRLVNPPLRGVFAGTSQAARVAASLPVTMRSSPSIAISQVSGATGQARFYDGTTSDGVISSLVSQWSSPNKIEADFNLSVSTYTLGRAACLYEDSNYLTNFDINAEL